MSDENDRALSEQEQRQQRTLESASRCVKSGKYLMAFFRIEDGKILCETVYEDFPNADFGRSVGLLYRHLKEQLHQVALQIPDGDGLMETSAVMPQLSGKPKPLVNLFGLSPGQG